MVVVAMHASPGVQSNNALNIGYRVFPLAAQIKKLRPFIFKGPIIGTCSYFGADYASLKNTMRLVFRVYIKRKYRSNRVRVKSYTQGTLQS
jgi:hypothetical protein